ncbi:MAG TPA: hypothetical protein VIP77_10495 [Jiangellaceae bacterium]
MPEALGDDAYRNSSKQQDLVDEMTTIFTDLAPAADCGLVRRIDQLQLLWQELFLRDWRSGQNDSP